MSSYDDTQRRETLAIINQMVKYISAKIGGGNAMDELNIDSDLKERMDAHLHVMLNWQRDYITFERVMAVLALIQEQLMTVSGTMTKRQIYYSNVKLFGSKQSAADKAIDQTCEIIAKVSNKWGSFARSSVAIIAAKKGMVYGAVTWTMPTGSCFNGMLGTGLSIEPDMNGIEFHLEPEVESIIVVEKDTPSFTTWRRSRAGRLTIRGQYSLLGRVILTSAHGFSCASYWTSTRGCTCSA